MHLKICIQIYLESHNYGGFHDASTVVKTFPLLGAINSYKIAKKQRTAYQHNTAVRKHFFLLIHITIFIKRDRKTVFGFVITFSFLIYVQCTLMEFDCNDRLKLTP